MLDFKAIMLYKKSAGPYIWIYQQFCSLLMLNNRLVDIHLKLLRTVGCVPRMTRFLLESVPVAWSTVK